MRSGNDQDQVFLHFDGMIEPIQTIGTITDAFNTICGYISNVAKTHNPTQCANDANKFHDKNTWIKISLQMNSNEYKLVREFLKK